MTPSTAPVSAAEAAVPAAATVGGFERLRGAFDPVPGYLNAATLGVPPRVTVAALREALDVWAEGRASASGYDAAVESSRASYARLVGVPTSAVAVGSQVSSLVGLVAAAVPDGGEILTVEGDFASVVFPLLVQADRGVTVRQVPLEALADAVRPSTTLVAYSLVQSADGRVADAPAVREAAAAAGALTLCDVTQAAGWLPVAAADVDVTVCAPYKWLCAPRGCGFLTVNARAAELLRPLHAGWYAGESVWDSVYGPTMELARDARRFDVSPAWLAWVGAAPVLDLFAGCDPETIRRHDAGLADAVREGLGMAPTGSAIVALPDPDGGLRARLEDAGCSVAGRAGRVRFGFHIFNDTDDVDRVLRAVGGAPSTG